MKPMPMMTGLMAIAVVSQLDVVIKAHPKNLTDASLLPLDTAMTDESSVVASHDNNDSNEPNDDTNQGIEYDDFDPVLGK